MKDTNWQIARSLFFDGNTGNNGNSSILLSNDNELSRSDLFPERKTDSGTPGTLDAIISPIPDDAPPVPGWMANIKVDDTRHPVTAEWEYRDAEGKLLFYLRRFDTGDGKKQFRQLTLWATEAGPTWQFKAPPEPRPLYGLDRLARVPHVPVLICEGERAADAAGRLFPEMVAVTSMGGAAAWAKSDWAPLQGREIYFWPDYDAPGLKYAQAVAQLTGAANARQFSLGWLFMSGLELPEQLPDGFDAADAEALGLTAAIIAATGADGLWNPLTVEAPAQPATEAATEAAGTLEKIGYALIEWKKGWRNGVYWQGPPGKDGPPLALWLCSPLRVLAETRDTEQSAWGRLLYWRDNDQHEHHWACPLALLAGRDATEFRETLVQGGLLIATDSRARTKLADYVVTTPPDSTERLRCVDRTGWYGEHFVTPAKVYGPTGGESVIYQGGASGADMAASGTLPQWQAEIAARAAGNSRVVFAIATAFAGPLVEPANEPGGGFQFTGKTGHGKTSCVIDPAASVWGHPGRFAKKWRTTVNGLESLCLSRNDCTLILDDLGQSDGRECGPAAYLIANGQGKARMRKEGGNRPLITWKTMLLSSGEIDLSQHMTEGGATPRGGQVTRLPSIPADAGEGLYVIEKLHDMPNGRAYSDFMRSSTRQYYGTAGVAFLEQLTTHLAEVTTDIRGTINGIVAMMPVPEGSAPEVGRVAARFALVAYAGELATRYGITGWPAGESLKAAIRCFTDWLRESGAAGADTKALLAQVAAFLQQHGASRFPPPSIGGDDLRRVLNRAGFSHYDGEQLNYWVESGTFRKELCRGFNPATAARALIQTGWLVPGTDTSHPYQHRKRVFALGEKQGLWVYVLSGAAIAGDV